MLCGYVVSQLLFKICFRELPRCGALPSRDLMSMPWRYTINLSIPEQLVIDRAEIAHKFPVGTLTNSGISIDPKTVKIFQL